MQVNMEDSFEYDDQVMYKDNELWSDIHPIEAIESNPVVNIAYSPEFKDVYDYFRAIVQKGELSKRALHLTEDAITKNPANYTVWQYRRKIIKKLSSDLRKELDFCQEMIELNPKNYQVWHHRRVIVEWLGDASQELSLTHLVFKQDAKNYHAWEHRQWALLTFRLFENELLFVEELLKEDIKNNSAWNHRYFVITHTSGFTPEVIAQETQYAMEHIEKMFNNESSWNYLRGVLNQQSCNLSDCEAAVKWTQALYQEGLVNTYMLAFMVDILQDLISVNEGNDVQIHVDLAVKLCNGLADEHDPIRREYWRFMGRKIAGNVQHKKQQQQQ